MEAHEAKLRCARIETTAPSIFLIGSSLVVRANAQGIARSICTVISPPFQGTKSHDASVPRNPYHLRYLAPGDGIFSPIPMAGA